MNEKKITAIIDGKSYILNLKDQEINDLLKRNSPVYFRHDNNVYQYNGSLNEFEKEIISVYQKISDDKKTDICELLDSIFADLLDHTREKTNIELKKTAEMVEVTNPKSKEKITKYRKAAKQFSKDELKTLNIKEENIIQFDKLQFDRSSKVNFDSTEELNCDEKNKKPSKSNKSKSKSSEILKPNSTNEGRESPLSENIEESKDEPKSCSFFSGDMF